MKMMAPPPSSLLTMSPAINVRFWPLPMKRWFTVSVPGVPLPREKLTADVRKEPISSVRRSGCFRSG